MIECPTVRKDVIRGHYDLSTVFYRLLWGPHIHHGLWADAADATPPKAAATRLTDTLADEAGIAGGERLLDVGCGMGGSSIRLAKTRGCDATGVTISPFQRRWAALASRRHGVSKRTRFLCADAETVAFDPASFDVVWSVECTEHLFDKAAFFRRTAGWTRPGGRVAICAWLAGDTDGRDDLRRQVYDVCEGFFCPSLGTFADYRGWIESAGLVVDRELDWTARVDRTWEICRDRVRRSRVRPLARLIDCDTVTFLDRFDTLLNAYRSGAMRYGAIVARKPA